jgi:decaprenylphospho-beta-D-ribofuranose 2-oxidase
MSLGELEATGVSRALSGWGRSAPSVSDIVSPSSPHEARAALQSAGERGLLARGLGRSYGDAAQNGGGLVVDMTRSARIHAVDVDAGTCRADAGVSLDRLLRTLLPLGATLPVQPGTRQVTLGGAIACDVHGKNHHATGSFGQHVRSFDLLTADGQVTTLSAVGPDPELFWGTIGGMGLTGIVLGAEIEIRPVETSYVVARSERCPDLEAVMARLAESDVDTEYSVAWFDSVARGRNAGRGVVLTGRDALVDDLPRRARAEPLAVPAPRRLRTPDGLPPGLVNRISGTVFNELWFRSAPTIPRVRAQPSFGFFHPLDAVVDWNRVYGPRGLCQYQLVVPYDAAPVIPAVVEAIAATDHVSCLNVLKRLGAADPAPLSFPEPGWTLAVDLPATPGLGSLLDRLDAMVLEAGGRVYLAKDSRLTARKLERMYPRLDEFRRLLDRVDPAGRFASDLARRLDLHPTTTSTLKDRT